MSSCIYLWHLYHVKVYAFKITQIHRWMEAGKADENDIWKFKYGII